jgi:hypothetical protein
MWLSLASLVFGKLASALPFLGQLWKENKDRDHEFRMAQLEAQTHRDEAVARVTELKAQVDALLATAEANHEAALDRAEQTVLDSLKPQELPFKEPRTWLERFVDLMVALNTLYNGWLRPYTATVVVTIYVGLVVLQAYVIVVDSSKQAAVEAFTSLSTVQGVSAAFGLIVGALWGERSWAHRMEKN